MPNSAPSRSTHSTLLLLSHELRGLHAEACTATGARFLEVCAEMSVLERKRDRVLLARSPEVVLAASLIRGESDLERALAVERGGKAVV